MPFRQPLAQVGRQQQQLIGCVAAESRRLHDDDFTTSQQLRRFPDRLLGAVTLPLTSSQLEELDHRLDELEAEGPTGLSWDEVVAQARARSR